MAEDNDNMIIAALPGSGWSAQMREGSHSWRAPVIAFLITEDGGVAPMTVTQEGLAVDVREDASFEKLMLPQELFGAGQWIKPEGPRRARKVVSDAEWRAVTAPEPRLAS